eukprot:Phypoly_transcript_11937.p1 GENE.Phypoly_transcript_11937~~Phypoly_transcript_11937.p1  ORF type:complete len:346 (+),score=78.36 Phypoly_transcript_11937:118-1155(+)
MRAATTLARSTRTLKRGITTPSTLCTPCTRLTAWNSHSRGYCAPAVEQRFANIYAGIQRGDRGLVRSELAKEGININTTDPKTNNTLLSAAVNGGFTEITRMLLVHGADVNGWVKDNGDSLLHIAIKNGNEPIALLLIQYGAKLNRINKENVTPLLCAVQCNRLGVVRALLKEGVKVKTVGDGEYPLNAAAKTGNLSIAGELVDHEANWKDALRNLPEGDTPVHLAAENNHGPMISFLSQLPHATPLTARAKDGYTALHIACERGNLAAVRVLVGLQADQHAEEKTGHSPYELAEKNGKKPVMDFLNTLKPLPQPKPPGYDEMVAAQAAAAAAAAAAPPPTKGRR